MASESFDTLSENFIKKSLHVIESALFAKGLVFQFVQHAGPGCWIFSFASLDDLKTETNGKMYWTSTTELESDENKGVFSAPMLAQVKQLDPMTKHVIVVFVNNKSRLFVCGPT